MSTESEMKDYCRQEPDLFAEGSDSEADARDALSLLAGGIAHDFNNLLTVINGYTQLILSEPSCRGKIRDFAGEISEAGAKAATIIDMVLACSGYQQIPQEPFDANALLESMRGAMTLLLGESISLILRLCDQSCVISGNRGQFQCVLTNLLMNSKEALPGGGRVELETRVIRKEDTSPSEYPICHPQLEITVRDDGYGMEKGVLDRIFDPYFTTKRRSNKPGQGLGLACTKGILRRLGGSITAESAPGAGTVFRIRLPIAEPA